MDVYAVIPLSNAPAAADLSREIQRLDLSAYVFYAPKVYFVRFKGTPQSLSSLIGFTQIAEESEQSLGIVIPFEDYFG